MCRSSRQTHYLDHHIVTVDLFEVLCHLYENNKHLTEVWQQIFGWRDPSGDTKLTSRKYQNLRTCPQDNHRYHLDLIRGCLKTTRFSFFFWLPSVYFDTPQLSRHLHKTCIHTRVRLDGTHYLHPATVNTVEPLHIPYLRRPPREPDHLWLERSPRRRLCWAQQGHAPWSDKNLAACPGCTLSWPSAATRHGHQILWIKSTKVAVAVSREVLVINVYMVLSQTAWQTQQATICTEASADSGWLPKPPLQICCDGPFNMEVKLLPMDTSYIHKFITWSTLEAGQPMEDDIHTHSCGYLLYDM